MSVQNPKINSRDWLLFVSTDNGVTYLPVACLTTQDLQSTLNTVDTTSKCGNEWQPGVKIEQKISFEGWTTVSTGTPVEYSLSALYDLHTARTVFLWKIGKALPVTGDYYFTGDGYISELTETAKDQDYNNFKGTLTVKTPPALRTAY